jgi:ERCC4-type nuclease
VGLLGGYWVVDYASSLDFVGKNERQRKVREIRVDTREQDAVTLNLLTGMGYTIDRHAMLIGDYGWDLREESWLHEAVYRTVVIERKSLADLRDVGRLERQLRKMSQDTKAFYIILIEYAFDTDRKRRWPEESILNAELSIQLGGVRVTRCEGNDVAGRLHSLYQWSMKRTHVLAGGD